jgi:serine/threonine-protein kinase HipA
MPRANSGESRGDHLKRRHWQRFARECGLNPRQVIDRVEALAKSAIAEAEAAEVEVTAMPAGNHPILRQTRQAIEQRARGILAQLQELEGTSAIEAVDEEGERAQEEVE